MTTTSIEWTEQTWNPTVGCSRVSAGCDHCYAVRQTHRFEHTEAYKGLTVLNGKGDRHFNGVVRCLPDRLSIPLKRKKPTMWFVNSMSDLFHPDVPFDFVDQVFAVMALCPGHTFQVRTKRPERMVNYLRTRNSNEQDWLDNLWSLAGHFVGGREADKAMSDVCWPLPNVWLGVSVEDQKAADERIPILLKVPAAVRFLSCEPLLGRIDLTRWLSTGGIHWVIVGGESGPNARPCDVEWIRRIVNQCKANEVPAFVKQLGSRPLCHQGMCLIECQCGLHYGFKDPKGGDMNEWPEDLRVREWPKAVSV